MRSPQYEKDLELIHQVAKIRRSLGMGHGDSIETKRERKAVEAALRGKMGERAWKRLGKQGQALLIGRTMREQREARVRAVTTQED